MTSQLQVVEETVVPNSDCCFATSLPRDATRHDMHTKREGRSRENLTASHNCPGSNSTRGIREIDSDLRIGGGFRRLQLATYDLAASICICIFIDYTYEFKRIHNI